MEDFDFHNLTSFVSFIAVTFNVFFFYYTDWVAEQCLFSCQSTPQNRILRVRGLHAHGWHRCQGQWNYLPVLFSKFIKFTNLNKKKWVEVLTEKYHCRTIAFVISINWHSLSCVLNYQEWKLFCLEYTM